jgi:hypothetical protein
LGADRVSLGRRQAVRALSQRSRRADDLALLP